jgi:EAL domain-containing protein (putative c-di-GMP-specific phosphodiesterase class I)
LLADLGCEYGQGFYFSRPVPAGDLDALLAKTSGLSPAMAPWVLEAPS